MKPGNQNSFNSLKELNINGKNYLVGSNRKFINTKDYPQNLPFIFGNFETEKFLEFKNVILQTDFKYNNIKKSIVMKLYKQIIFS